VGGEQVINSLEKQTELEGKQNEKRETMIMLSRDGRKRKSPKGKKAA
jgi:hypothetical protein